MRSERLLFTLFALVLSLGGKAQPAMGTWSNTGPVPFPVNVSGQVHGIGRVCQVKFSPTDPQKVYAVSASGGLYISNDNGQTWTVTPGTETMPTTACASVCIDYTNDQVMYLSTGDPNYYYADYGIYKTTNGGLTWNPVTTNIGFRMALEMIMDPTNNNTIVAATNNGIWKTTNGGSSWTQTHTGGSFRDMKLVPGSHKTLYAVTATQFYRSIDFGDTWTQISTGLTIPAGNGGLRLAVSAADTNVVYVSTTGGNGVINRSDDRGTNFTTVYNSNTQCLVCYDDNPASGSQGNYNFGLAANPQNANELLLVAHCVWRSTDGGVTWSKRTSWWNECHTDMHQIQWNPYNNSQRFNANDGGVWMSTDTLATAWSPRSDGIAATEIYHAAQSPLLRQMVSIGTQDNGELYYDNIWKCNRGGDWGTKCRFDYLNNASVYYLSSGNRRDLLPLGGDNSFNSPFEPTNSSDIEFLPNMHNIAFAGNDTIWRSNDIDNTSPTWTQLYITGETMRDIESCHADSNILYVVTNSGHIYRSDNALAASPSFTMLNTPSGTAATASLATDKQDKNIVYLTCGQYIYRSSDKGLNWTNITLNLPSYNIIRVLSDDYSTTERLFVCLGNYVYYKDNAMANWTLTNGLPTIPNISDFMIYNDGTAASILRLSTYGRGVWECNIQNNLLPIGDFSADKQYICPGDTVHFIKHVYGNVTSFVWLLPGGSPNPSAADSPVVVYNTPGTYDASLVVNGVTGSDTILKHNYIVVSQGSPTSIQEGFEANTFPPVEWSLRSGGGNWQHVDSVGGFGLSTHSAFFDNYNYDAGGKHDALVAPKADLTNADSAFVTFDVAYAPYSAAYPDSLLVQLSTDCGHTYAPVYVKSGDTLATAPATGGYFVPTAAQWRKDTISLNAWLGNSTQLSFENVGHYGNALYLDNVNIVIYPHPVNVNRTETGTVMRVYPNPSKGIFTLSAKGLASETVTLSCYNMTGALISRSTLATPGGTGNTTLDMSEYPRGIYQINLETASGQHYTQKLILE
jgi:photosystem II stability/assembly factor-like uncharacterized protein/PKD repeat protein